MIFNFLSIFLKKKGKNMQLTLTPEIENILKIQALNFGITPEMLVLDILAERFSPITKTESEATKHESLADYLSDYIGTVSSDQHIPGGAHMSEKCGKKFSEGLLMKRQKGKL
jgi:hypothetical protein